MKIDKEIYGQPDAVFGHVIHRLVPSLYRFEIMQCDELSKQSPTIKSFNLAVPQTPLIKPIGKFRVTRKKLRKGP